MNGCRSRCRLFFHFHPEQDDINLDRAACNPLDGTDIEIPSSSLQIQNSIPQERSWTVNVLTHKNQESETQSTAPPIVLAMVITVESKQWSNHVYGVFRHELVEYSATLAFGQEGTPLCCIRANLSLKHNLQHGTSNASRHGYMCNRNITRELIQ